MSRIRDIANLFSGSTDAATDAEVASAISSHNSATTSVHGITDTSVLATSTSVSSAISTHATAANGHSGRGTTANRPASPTVGDLYFDTTLDSLMIYKASGWINSTPVPNAPTSVSASQASSGFGSASVSFTGPINVAVSSYTVTSSPGNLTATGSSSPIVVSGLSANTSYTFTVTATGSNGVGPASSASSSITTPAAYAVDYLVVAGGGSGGASFAGGGGGAGGFLTGTSFAITPSTLYNVTVGAGGSAGTNGSNSVFSTITSIGGGMGGGSFNNNAAIGGSGGGTASLNFASNGAAGTSGQGFRGGNSPSPAYSSPYGGTGGGGAGAAGGDQPSSTGNTTAGGIGVQSSITGTAIHYAGGGGGGAGAGGAGAGGNGGVGGGGKGGSGNSAGSAPADAPVAGTANTGGGGGGTGNYQTAPAGGSGIVVLRYPDTYPNPVATTGSPTITNTGGYKIYKFTVTGSITF